MQCASAPTSIRTRLPFEVYGNRARQTLTLLSTVTCSELSTATAAVIATRTLNQINAMEVDQVSNGAPQSSRGRLRFRNYVPADEQLKALLLPYKPLKLAREVADTIVATATERIQKFKQENPLDRLQDDVDIIKQLRPKKADFDLKRNIQRKITLLDKRTQKAIMEIRAAEESDEDSSSGDSNDEDGSGSSASSSDESG